MTFINSLSDITGINEKILYAIHSGIIILNSQKQLIYANSNINNIFNGLVTDLKGQINCEAINCINKHIQNCSTCKMNLAIDKLFDNNETTVKEEILFNSSNNEQKFLEFSTLEIYHNSEKLVILIIDDITEKKLLYKSIEEKSYKLEDQVIKLENQNSKLIELTESLEEADSILMAIANSIEAKDIVTQGHTQRVAFYSRKIGEYMGLNAEELEILRKGCILHDVGKMGIPDDILKKPNRLTIEEYQIMKQHPVIGEQILNPLKSFENVSKLVRHHHERLNGSGYPDGLKGDEIDLLVRITAVVDIYDAIASDRPYRKGLSREKSISILRDGASKNWWDRDVVEMMDKVSKEYWNLFRLN